MFYLGIFCISVAEFPIISVSENRTVEHNSHVVITCNLTEGEMSTASLEEIAWYKNEVRFERMRSPNPDNPDDFLTPLDLPSVGVRDGGVYTCLLEVLLRRVRSFNISKSMELRSKNIILLKLPCISQ